MQTRNRLLDDLARVAAGALGIATGVRDEAEALLRQRFERVLTNMDLVTREEFETVKAMAVKARAEQETMAKKLAELEAAGAARKPAAKRSPRKPTAKTPSRKAGRGKTAG
ncbi:MAG: accessory factor UbiK family protein [Alphaproteobacteria bacterium]